MTGSMAESKTPRGHKHQVKGGQQRHGETFESMSKDEMAADFDFEESNAQFEKCKLFIMTALALSRYI